MIPLPLYPKRNFALWYQAGSVALTTAGQQKSCCLFFRQPTDKIALQATILRPLDDEAVLYGAYLPAQCLATGTGPPKRFESQHRSRPGSVALRNCCKVREVMLSIC